MRLATEATWTGVAVALACMSTVATSASLHYAHGGAGAPAVRCERIAPSLPADVEDAADDLSCALASQRYALRHASTPSAAARPPHPARAAAPRRPVVSRLKIPPPSSSDVPAH